MHLYDEFNEEINMKNYILIAVSLCLTANMYAQKRVHFSKIEIQKNGLYYQINTIEPFTGTAYEVYPPKDDKEKEKSMEEYEVFLKTARKKEEVQFVNGKTQGKAKGWDEFGQKIYEASFVESIQEGLERQWYPNGQQKVEVNYVQSVPNGKATEWYSTGGKKSEGEYVNGREEGMHTWWYENGNKDQQITYADGLEEGMIRKWYENGERMLEAQFEAGKRNGTNIEWHKNGQKKAEGQYVTGKEVGRFSSWSSKGKLLDVKEYEQGELVKSMDYRSGGIRSQKGFVQVFNEMTSYFKVSVEGAEVKTINTGNIGFIVDGKILQMMTIPVSNFRRGNMPLSTEDMLLAQMRDEMNNVRETLDKQAAYELFPENQMLNAEGREALHWYFKAPIKSGDETKARTVLEEHYLSTVCGNYILVLNSVVTNSDRREDIIQLLKNTAQTIQIEKKHIDLNVLRNEILGR